MKPSGAPETGDLVRPKKGKDRRPNFENYKNWWHTGLIIECRGIECLVMWAGPMEGNWWPRSQLKVISESR